MELATTAGRVAGVTLVGAILENPGRRRRVRLVDRSDGPVWPPRRRGVPERGWDEEGVDLLLDPGEVRAVGYATPAEPAEPPVTIATVEPPTDGGSEGAPAAAVGVSGDVTVPRVDRTPRGVVRALDDPAPPRGAVPVRRPPADSAGGESQAGGIEGATTGGATTDRRWLDAAARRIERAERLAAADDLASAADRVAQAGGLDGARDLAETVDRDAAELRRVARRAAALAERAERVDVPVETFERLA